MAEQYDVVIVGGGHNGLVAAAYLAREGLRTLVLERRHIVGGAAVTETPFGPEFKLTTLSYVVSWLPPTLVRDLDLVKHGYHVYPQGPYFAPRTDGSYLQLPDDKAARRAQIAKFSEKDADAVERWDDWMDRLGRILGPMVSELPPKLGSRKPSDLGRQALLLRRLKDVDERAAVDLVRLLTDSAADLIEDYFESDAMKGVLSVSAVIGSWAGPRTPGTAYVIAHHHIGDLGDGRIGAWGFPRGGMGGVTQALAAAARSFGAEIRTEAPVARITTRNGATTGVVLDDGTEISAPTVITTAHPQVSFLRLLDTADLPPDFVADIERYRSRSGTVKINVALDRLPEFVSKPGFDPQVHGGTIVLSESLDEVEASFQEAAAGRPSTLPFADICIPSVFDPTLAPEGKHVMSMFTQWVPHTWNDEPHREELDAYADRLFARMEVVAPGFTDSVLHRQVLGPWDIEHEYGLVGGNIFHGELTMGQMFHGRPAAGFADLRTPVKGLYQAGSGTHGGGGVTGVPGRNVVHQILADRRREQWKDKVRDLTRPGS
ncbi:MAG: NAD(P)/FAD-dependent oxidoreductase [Actinobacteria bacterium]|nr:NAD(P)/FAD-dependent oxidoreductase [Actinomycetota bacterium]